MAEVELEHVEKRFEDRDDGGSSRRKAGTPPSLRDVSFSVAKGELLVVVGPSGCGKSTTLRIIAGLERADAGSVRIGGRDVESVPPQERDVAMVFQGYALYPQMTVRENIEFPLKMRGMAERERRSRLDEAAEMLRLGRFLDRRPAELSGGERQRVAMGRAIVRRPRVFLFDEPLSNLDAALRQELRVEIGVLVRRLGATAIYVTHDQVEAMTLADRICVMREGRVQMIAAPREIYERPQTSFVGTFLGAPRMNLLRGRVEGGAVIAGPFRLPAPAVGRETPSEIVVGIRPEDTRLVGDASDGAAPFDVVLSEPLGAETHLLLRTGDIEFRARTQGFRPRAPGERVHLAVDASRLHFFDVADDRRLS